MSKRLTRCEVQICTDPEDVDKPRCTAEVRRLREALDIATARLELCGEWSALNQVDLALGADFLTAQCNTANPAGETSITPATQRTDGLNTIFAREGADPDAR